MSHNSNLESAQDGGDALLQVVPSLVAFVNHLFEAARRVCAVLSGQAAVLLVDQFQLGQAFMDLSLEGLGSQRMCISVGDQGRTLVMAWFS
jgi:hypothetical protein